MKRINNKTKFNISDLNLIIVNKDNKLYYFLCTSYDYQKNTMKF